MSKKLKVVELFAGVGGFRLGLENNNKYEVIWSNQWEPLTKTQHASMVYEERFGGEGHVCEDIGLVPTSAIPQHDLLVGGFPCQDYSVATTLKNSKGLLGKKGVLWWSIQRILDEKRVKPKYLLLENVDRLLKSPAIQRGRDFAVMLKSLDDLGYGVEWRVVNAADYGMPQRRRRVFFLGYHKNTDLYKKMKNKETKDWIFSSGVLAKSFPVKPSESLFVDKFSLEKDIVGISKNFNKDGKISPFLNAGVMINGEISTASTSSNYTPNKNDICLLKDVLDKEKDIEEEFYIKNKELASWKYQKGAKKEERVAKNGHVYQYSEGAMVFPDSLDKPSRTIITGEGGSSASRFKHVIQPLKNKKNYRRLTPLELERLNMFPDNHTKLDGVSNSKRAFLMGNALVVGVVEKIGKELYKLHQETTNE